MTAGAYLISISETVNNAQQIGASALLIVNNYILAFIWENDFIYLFASHNYDENGILSRCDTAVLLRFDILQSLENYISQFITRLPL